MAYRGRPLVCHVAATALQAGWRPVIVLLGSRAREVAPSLVELPVEMVENPLWGTSIQAGLKTLEGREVDGAILALADQPLVGPTVFRGLVIFTSHPAARLSLPNMPGPWACRCSFTPAIFGTLGPWAPVRDARG